VATALRLRILPARKTKVTPMKIASNQFRVQKITVDPRDALGKIREENRRRHKRGKRRGRR
jgi:hypothetical protein